MQAETAINLFVKKTGGWVASQLEACTRCGLCATACHYYEATGKPEFAPVWKVELLRRAYEQRFTLVGKAKVAMGIEKPISDDDIKEWSVYDFHGCSMCNKCSFVCPMGIDIASLIGAVRAGITAAGEAPAGLVKKTEVQLATGSPNGATREDYAAWFARTSKEMGKELPVDKKGAHTLLLLTNLEIAGFPNNLVAIAKILDAAKIDWTLSLEARDAFNMGTIIGNGKAMKQLADKVYNTAVDLGVKRVLVSCCGHGYTTLRDKLPNVMGKPLPFEVQHIAELMGVLVRDGKIKLQEGYFANGHTYTFHDSCKIQRAGGIMDEPRLVLRQLAGDSFHEMLPNRKEAICCGGGGGLRAIPEAYDIRMAAFGLKVDQIKKAGADTVVTTCSNCRLQFKEGFEHYKLDTQVTGLAELMSQAIVE
ncbi:MAG: (Fe-S)-binding protein [Ardenticatenaceae bacterium]|nr:(Fe-S)-binding protein [Anaerolineales bacterium]MCB8920254.1 (Fe-S)-binding protein [Ardenticatenaceae bacterium]MCB8991987.1 (Fe-S)-binding protein [Ardenticatenaceae bacterium]MCB9004926.1 (Fe-S)-binding protein [Ardenticatenaceae bacterium]